VVRFLLTIKQLLKADNKFRRLLKAASIPKSTSEFRWTGIKMTQPAMPWNTLLVTKS